MTIGNITDAYNKAASRKRVQRGVCVQGTQKKQLIDKYADLTGEPHTDLHECLGHGSGKLLPGSRSDALKAYGSTIEEARADLFGLYYVADPKLLELGLVPSEDAYKAEYYTYLMNGLMTQLGVSSRATVLKRRICVIVSLLPVGYLRKERLIKWWKWYRKMERLMS